MIDYSKYLEKIHETPLGRCSGLIGTKVNEALAFSNNGNLPKWFEAYNELPSIKPSKIDLNSDYILIGQKDDCPEQERKKLEYLLRQYHPWRKGPFNIFGIKIESEWRSDFKWERLKNRIATLKGRSVLDVGSGNGYHCLRMVGAGANLVLGVDFTLLYAMQFQAIQKYVNNDSATVLPIGIDDLPEDMNFFDTVFSMGVIYHRKEPVMHLKQLKSFLRSKGEMVLESLVIEGDKGEVLSPADRYAKMRNVHFVPSILTLEDWIKSEGFENIRLIDVTKTTSEEQRVTDWMGFQSLDDFLDPEYKDLTIEGYPAPKRAIFLATKY